MLILPAGHKPRPFFTCRPRQRVRTVSNDIKTKQRSFNILLRNEITRINMLDRVRDYTGLNNVIVKVLLVKFNYFT